MITQAPADESRQQRVIKIGLRLAVSILIGVLAAFAVGTFYAKRFALLVGWDVTALVYLTWLFAIIGPLDHHETAALVKSQDPGRKVADTLLFVASLASLVAVVVALFQAGDSHGRAKIELVALGAISIAISWAMVHVLFALRYARLYFTDPIGGIDFNGFEDGEGSPTYMDFAYVAFTVGMTFQVSDTNIKKSSIRAAILHHALVAYFFGVVIVSAAINVLAGLGGK